jgi:hypothetical protein
VWAFGRAHGDDDTGVVESVVLAATNHRWTTIGRPLLERLTDRGLLDEGHAGQLGLCFLEADVVPVTVPGAWLADLYRQQRGDEVGRLDPPAATAVRDSHRRPCSVSTACCTRRSRTRYAAAR